MRAVGCFAVLYRWGMLLVLGWATVGVLAQLPPGGPSRPGGTNDPNAPALPPGPIGNLANARERLMTRLQEKLEATEEEWKILRPRVERVMVLQIDAKGGVGSAMTFLRLPPGFLNILRAAGWLDALGPFAALLDSPVTTAAEELRDVLADENARGADIAFHLGVYRRACEKSRKELATAQAELSELLTPRQEAYLTMQGLLD